MNSKSGKFCTLKLGKLVTLARVHAPSPKIGSAVNLLLRKFSECRIESAEALPIGGRDRCDFSLSRGKVENWSRYKFPALKIETV